MSNQSEHHANGHLPPEAVSEVLHITVAHEDGQTIVKLSGSVVSGTAGALLDALSDILSDGCKNLHLDLSGVHDVSRAGVRGIIVAAKAMQTRGGNFQISGTREGIVMVLDGLLLKALISKKIQERTPIPRELSEGADEHGSPSQSNSFWQRRVGL